MYSNNCNCNCNLDPVRINGSLSGVLSNPVLRGMSAYELAVQNGFEGSEEEFLDSLKGDSVEFKQENGFIFWKYVNDEKWIELIHLSGKLDSQQDIENAGKVLVIGDDGMVSFKEVKTLQFVDEESFDEMLNEVFG